MAVTWVGILKRDTEKQRDVRLILNGLQTGPASGADVGTEELWKNPGVSA